jgi:hypothetical protein
LEQQHSSTVTPATLLLYEYCSKYISMHCTGPWVCATACIISSFQTGTGLPMLPHSEVVFPAISTSLLSLPCRRCTAMRRYAQHDVDDQHNAWIKTRFGGSSDPEDVDHLSGSFAHILSLFHRSLRLQASRKASRVPMTGYLTSGFRSIINHRTLSPLLLETGVQSTERARHPHVEDDRNNARDLDPCGWPWTQGRTSVSAIGLDMRVDNALLVVAQRVYTTCVAVICMHAERIEQGRGKHGLEASITQEVTRCSVVRC